MDTVPEGIAGFGGPDLEQRVSGGYRDRMDRTLLPQPDQGRNGRLIPQPAEFTNLVGRRPPIGTTTDGGDAYLLVDPGFVRRKAGPLLDAEAGPDTDIRPSSERVEERLQQARAISFITARVAQHAHSMPAAGR
ncbi:hypothetical protein Ait01nite_016760 [Actinoplanes italicus]|nr:hypothetical protein Ait01nite_016760 [Actinoplanes italicus]